MTVSADEGGRAVTKNGEVVAVRFPEGADDDSRIRIDELKPLLAERGIAAEYGHVLQLLLPRERIGLSCQPDCL